MAIGYSPQTIRKVSLKLPDRHRVDRPFAMDKRFRADGRAIFEEVVTDEGERRLVNLMNDNFEIVPVIEPTLFGHDWVRDEHPPGTTDPNWIRKFADDGGQAFLSGDFQILQHWPDLIAYIGSGLIAFFPPPGFEC
jgi:hypothetical protein